MKQFLFLFTLSILLFSCKGDGSVQTKENSFKNTDEYDYQTIIDNSENPVVIDFWAAWCGPCKMISPVIEELAEEYQGEITVLKINVDKNPEISQKYNIRSLPSVVYFKNGEIIDKQIGAYPKQEYKQKFKKLAGH